MRWFTRLLGLSLALVLSTSAYASGKYKPFVLAYKASGAVQAVAGEVASKLTKGGFEIVGRYSPYEGATVIAVTNDRLKKTAAQSEFGGYGAAQRVSITKVGNEIQVAYTNPSYMALVYRMKGDLKDVYAQLEKTLGKVEEFGPEKPLRERKLKKYHYMFGMEYFDDVNKHFMAQHKSYQAAVETVERNLKNGVAGVTKVYRVDIPGKNETVFGVAMKKPEEWMKNMDDSFIMSEIDFKPLRSTAHLPYEILVSDKKVYSLYARFRIAISFPDLAMMGEHSFMNIMESPEAIKKALTQAAGGEYNDNYWE